MKGFVGDGSGQGRDRLPPQYQPPMKIMVLAWDIPATTNMPGSPRLFSLCKRLSPHHRLMLVSFNRSQERHQTFLDDPAIRGVFEKIEILPSAPVPDWRGRQMHRLRQEPHFVTRYRNPEFHAQLCQRIRDIFTQGGFDAIYADGLVMAQYVIDSRLQCPAVIDLHDSLTLLYSRTMRAEPRWLRKLALFAEMRSIGRWERSLSRRFGAIITNSRVDEAFLRSLDASGHMVTIGNGVDGEFFMPAGGESDMTKLVFTGVMNYAPNEDSAVYFCDSILPLIRKRHPRAQFWVVGKDPTEKVQRLAQRPGVHVTGGVADMRPFLETAGVFVCPIRFGAGVKNKILAALAMQKPVVATSLSLEGLDLREDEHVLIADEPERFAAQVMRLMEDPDLAARLGRNGQAFVRAEYSWESSALQLDAILRATVNDHRRLN
jgi:sugar transferase (PEP-CTERM/EpsH1 system associated)